jgi:pectin methylesterase-like acyl-CoA thioesterase
MDTSRLLPTFTARIRPHAAILAAFALASAARAQGVLWVVDDSGGPGVDYTSLQAAIDGSANGDTILVRAGYYGSAVIDGKALIVTSENAGAPAAVQTSSLTVRSLGAAQGVVLRGL